MWEETREDFIVTKIMKLILNKKSYEMRKVFWVLLVCTTGYFVNKSEQIQYSVYLPNEGTV